MVREVKESRGKSRVQFVARLILECLKHPSRYVKEAVGYKNLELNGELRAGFINVIVVRVLLYLRLDPGGSATGIEGLGLSPRTTHH